MKSPLRAEYELALTRAHHEPGTLISEVIEVALLETFNKFREPLVQQLATLRCEHLRVLRLRAGLSIGPASELLGIGREYLAALEAGREGATDNEWQSIFTYLNMATNTGAA